MTRLQLAPHTRTNDTVVEIWEGSLMIGVIYPHPGGVKIISKYIENRPDLVTIDPAEPPALIVRLFP